MRRLRIFILICSLLPSLAYAEDLYFGQVSAGADSGTACATRHDVTWFNTPSNWGVGVSRISEGDTAHLCGTVSTPLVFQGSGTIGNVITLVFETGAAFVHPTFCTTAGCINMDAKSYLVLDGGTACGYIARVDTACNGVISNTTAQPGASSSGVSANGCANCEIKNLEVGPIYRQTGGGTYNGAGNYFGIANLSGGTPAGSTYKVHHNKIHDAGTGIPYVPVGATDAGIQAYNNLEYDNNSGVDISNVAAQMTGSLIHDNHFGTTLVWDHTGCPTHHNTLHSFATVASGGVNAGIDYYNNFTDGDWGMCGTAGLFMEGGVQGGNQNYRVFNNVWAMTGTNTTQWIGSMVSLSGSGTAGFYNNTIIHPNLPPRPVLAIGDTLNVTAKNNVIISLRNANLVVLGPSPTITAWDYSIYETPTNFVQILARPPTYWSFTGWKAANSGVDLHASYVLNGATGINTTTGVPAVGSAVIDAGVDLSSLGITALNSDALGNARPAGGLWDLGAIEFGAGTPTPTTPTGHYIAAFKGNTFAVLIWPAVTGASGYVIYRSTVSGSYGSPLATITTTTAAAAHSPVTQYIDSKLYTGTTYYYKIASLDGSSNLSALSTEISVAVTGKQ